MNRAQNIARLVLWAFVLGAMSPALAADSGSLRAELSDLKAKVAAMETAEDGCNACGQTVGNCKDCGAGCLTSAKGNGNITIGGHVHVDLLFIHGESNEVTNANGDGDDYRRTVFDAGQDVLDSSYLDFRIDAADNMHFHISLELNNDENGAGDILEYLYFAWEGVRGSSWDLYIGQKDVSYGMDKFVGIMPTFHDGGAYLLAENLGGPSGATAGNTSGAIGVQGANVFATQGFWTTGVTEVSSQRSRM